MTQDPIVQDYSRIYMQFIISPTFSDFLCPGSVSRIQVNLFDQLDVGEKRDEGHEKGVGHDFLVLVSGGVVAKSSPDQILFNLRKN